MENATHIDNPDVILIGSGVMSANLGALLKRLAPNLRIQLYETTDGIAHESSHGFNNAGTGHAGICEIAYTPNMAEDGTVDVAKAINIFEQFELSLQFWGHAVGSGMIRSPSDFIRPVSHIAFVHGEKQVNFLRARHEAMARHHFFADMEFTTDGDTIREWAPLVMEGRPEGPVAATKMDAGTDVNFGEVSRKLIGWLAEQPGCGVATEHRVINLNKRKDDWEVTIRPKDGATFKNHARFVFIGAGGGSLPLLQKAGIPEARGYGAFPVGGQWLVCDNPEIVARHNAKVYGQALDEAPSMAVPHLDKRTIDGKQWLLFGPYAAFTTKFLHGGGSWTDLPGSLRLDNLWPLVRVGGANIPLVRYLIQQGTQSMASRIKTLRRFYPDANPEDWRLMDGGIRVQAIQKIRGKPGIVHDGTEVVTSEDKSIAALLGASPGASVSVHIMMEVIENCFGELLKDNPIIDELIPTYRQKLILAESADTYRSMSEEAKRLLQLDGAAVVSSS